MSNDSSKPGKADIPPAAAATDIPTFIGELEAGLCESFLSQAVSETAAAVVNHEKKKKGGRVTFVIDFEHIENTQQVRLEHSIKFKRPTQFGAREESYKGASVMHVGKRGRLTVTQPQIDGVPPRQASIDDK